MRVVGYVRVSTDDQVLNGNSLGDQATVVRAYCEAMGHSLVSIIEDAGVSARSLERRGLSECLGMLDDGSADALLVVRLDRLTRSVKDFALLFERFEREGWNLLSVRDSLDTTTATGRFFLNMMVSLSQLEREQISERTVAALAAKMERGERVGRPPMGRTVVDGELVWLPGWERAKDAAAGLRARGLSNERVAAVLTEDAVIDGKTWNRESVRRLLAQ